jgi:Uma2 family endonuclease
MAGTGGGPPEDPGAAQAQLRGIAELLERQRRWIEGLVTDGSGHGGEAGDDDVSSSTSDTEGEMPTLQDPAPRPYKRVTPRQYLVREQRAEYKTEYNDGELVAMAGASRRHSLIASRLLAALSAQLRGTGCEVHGSDMKVKADEGQRYVYPDLSVVCGRPAFEGRSEDVLLNPTLVVEVLSPSTARNDRGWKLEAYQRLSSLREVVLLWQDAPVAEVFRRDAGGGWEAFLPIRGEGALLRLESIGCVVSLAALYDGLPAPHEPGLRPLPGG